MQSLGILHGPNSCSGSYVENALARGQQLLIAKDETGSSLQPSHMSILWRSSYVWIWANGSQVESLVQREFVQMMGQILLIIGVLIIGSLSRVSHGSGPEKCLQIPSKHHHYRHDTSCHSPICSL
jgi:hypothetical protein